MVNYRIFFSKNAEKDKAKLKSEHLETKAKELLNIIAEDPFAYPPSYEKLVGDLDGFYSRRVNIKHRIVYSVDEKNKVVIIARMFTHYEK